MKARIAAFLCGGALGLILGAGPTAHAADDMVRAADRIARALERIAAVAERPQHGQAP